MADLVFGSGDIFPGATLPNVTDACWRDAEGAGQNRCSRGGIANHLRLIFGQFLGVFAHVLGWSKQFKVVRVTALLGFARVVYMSSLRDRAVPLLPEKDMHGARHTVDADFRIAAAQLSAPNPAPFFGVNVITERLFLPPIPRRSTLTGSRAIPAASLGRESKGRRSALRTNVFNALRKLTFSGHLHAPSYEGIVP